MAPYFANGDDKGTGYSWSTKDGSTSSALVWKGSQWSAGGNNQYPKANPTISSFEVLDQLIKYFDNQTVFPNMKHIVIAGHSLGAQAVARYTQIGNQFATKSKVTYWIGNPNNFAWMSTDRPISSKVQDCPTYDVYRDGYANFTQYPMTYATDLVAAGRSAILANFKTKSKVYARGTQDFGDTSSNCNPFTTGANRNERFFNFIKQWPPSCTSTSGPCDTVDYVDAGHDAGTMFAAPAGRARLFTDNFYGDNVIAPDFGYPRLQAGDDPLPDPKFVDPNRQYTDGNTYAGNMKYQGCWTDDYRDLRALGSLAYDNSSNTVELCTAACSSQGFNMAGLEYGSQCWCGNSISAYSANTADVGCSQKCSGNDKQKCGYSGRLSVYSSGSLVQNPKAQTSPIIKNYAYKACMNESTTGRLLDDKSFADGTNMTLDGCMDYCQGYQYFAITFASQCFCGNSFLSVANVTAESDCYMPCTGDVSDLCGGPNKLSVYSMQYKLAVPTTTTTTTTTTITTTTTTTSTTATTSTTTTTTTTTTSSPRTMSTNPPPVVVISTIRSTTSPIIPVVATTLPTRSTANSAISTARQTTASTPAANSNSARSSVITTRSITTTRSTSQPTTMTTATSSAIVWSTQCTAPCFAGSNAKCAPFQSQVLSFCKTKIKDRLTTMTLTTQVTTTKTKTDTRKTATITKVTAKATPATTTASFNTKATCAGAVTALKGYSCAQVTSLCRCQVVQTRTTSKTVTVSSTITVWPKATKTVTVKA